ncbi:MAG: glycosyltransferase [Chitinivibrionia bacterium]|nr:glycosyltransferase [Chitinivibrionia bacterium]
MNFSVIIPFRNEKENLDGLLKSLSAQITSAKYEIIMIDDFSDDGGGEVVREYVGAGSARPNQKHLQLGGQTPPLRLLHRKDFPNNPNISSKQNALDIGASFAQYEYLLFTDADMIFAENWIENYRITIEENKADFVFGRTGIVCDCVGAGLKPALTYILAVIQKAQLDFLFSLAFIFNKLKLEGSAMGNNLAISAAAYKKIGGQAALDFSLVEDKKLLSAVKKSGFKVVCTKKFEALAYTLPVPFNKFFQQTLRWVKGGIKEDPILAALLIVFALGNLLIFPSFILILLLMPVFLKHKTGVIHIFLLPFFFFIETIALTFGLFFVKLRWKDRQI